MSEGDFCTEHVQMAGQACTLVVHQAPLSHHAIGVIFRDQIDLRLVSFWSVRLLDLRNFLAPCISHIDSATTRLKLG